jgi:hypothetical protein
MKQAVLLIHGIGEQRPMDSLRSFVHAVWKTDTSLHRKFGNTPDGVWSKPYDLSDDYELRRLTTAESAAGIRTDFFEFYWAHLMRGTEVGHVVAWAKTLLLRNPATVPKHLRLAYWTLVILVAIGIFFAIRGAAMRGEGASGLPVWGNLLVTAVVLPFVVGILTNTVGDAARYLHVAPTNVRRRHAIRSAGIKVLKSLHERGYDRIIVVGHSLGSVIAYDVLNYGWSEYNTDEPKAANAEYTALTNLEEIARKQQQGGKVDDVQKAQRAYLNEMKANGLRWRVTDFVTLGSPLAHAAILLARNADALASHLEDREFARCLPVLEESTVAGKAVFRFSYPADAKARTPHHGAVFAPVRWTNLYFPNTLLLHGDLVGGPLHDVLGEAVRDVPVKTSLRRGLFTHTLYWTLGRGEKDDHIRHLRDALDLGDARRG